MGKLEFLEALKRAMTGLAPEIQAKTLAFYEQRFVDGVAIGRSEEDVSKELDDPKKIAMTLRASTHMKSFETKKNPANFVRMAFAAIGLAIFNLFMVVPAMVYAALLAALYATGLAFYLGGTVITGSGLSGNNELRLDGPLSHVFDSDGRGQTKVNISEEGIHIYAERGQDGKSEEDDGDVLPEDAPENTPAEVRQAAEQAKAAAKAAAKEGARAAAIAAAAGAAAEQAAAVAAAATDEINGSDSKPSVRAIKRAESFAAHGIMFSTGNDDESRGTQIFIGLALVLGGIMLLLLSLVITRYTFIGLRRYIEMNFALLKGH